MNKTWIGSPNYTNTRQGVPITEFVMHHMAGTLAGTDKVFQDRRRNTSAHAGFEEDNAHEYVDTNNIAYHAGNWAANQRSIGLEHSGDMNRKPSQRTMDTSAEYIVEKIRQHNVPATFKAHKVYVSTACPGLLDINYIAHKVNSLLGGAVVTPVVTPPPTILASFKVKVTVDALNVRTQPNSQSSLAKNRSIPKGYLTRDQSADIVAVVQGENVRGVSTWLKTINGNYIWAGGTSYRTTPAMAQSSGGIATVTGNCNVRTAPRVNAPLGGSMSLKPGDRFEYTAIVYGDYVGNNNKWYHSKKGNYVWSGNVKG